MNAIPETDIRDFCIKTVLLDKNLICDTIYLSRLEGGGAVEGRTPQRGKQKNGAKGSMEETMIKRITTIVMAAVFMALLVSPGVLQAQAPGYWKTTWEGEGQGDVEGIYVFANWTIVSSSRPLTLDGKNIFTNLSGWTCTGYFGGIDGHIDASGYTESYGTWTTNGASLYGTWYFQLH